MSRVQDELKNLKEQFNLGQYTHNIDSDLNPNISVKERVNNIRNYYANMNTSNMAAIQNRFSNTGGFGSQRDDDAYNLWKKRVDEQVEKELEEEERKKKEKEEKKKREAIKAYMKKHGRMDEYNKLFGHEELKAAPPPTKTEQVKDFASGAFYGLGDTLAKPLEWAADKVMFDWNKKADYKIDGKESKYPKGYSKETDAMARGYDKEQIEHARQQDEISAQRVAMNKPYGWTPSGAESMGTTVGGVAGEFAQMAMLGGFAGLATKGITGSSKLAQLGKFAAESGIVGTGLGVLRSMDKKDNTAGDYLRNVAAETAFMGVGGAVGKGASTIVGRGLSSFGKPAVEQIGKTIAKGAGFGGGGSVASSLIHGDEINAKDIGVNAGIGVLFELGMNAKSIRGLLKRGKQTSSLNTVSPEVKKSVEAKSEILKNDLSSQRNNRNALDWHNKKYAEFKKAENDWESAVHEVQNRFGQKELTKAEELIAKKEMGYNFDELINNYSRTQNEYRKAFEGLQKSIRKNVNKEAFKYNKFDERYGLNKDISNMSQQEIKAVFKDSFNKILEDSGKNISKNLKTNNIYDIAKHYEKKYELAPVQVKKINKPGGQPAESFFNEDSVVVEINAAYNKNQQIGALRHEVEHAKDFKVGYEPTPKISEPNAKYNTVEDLYNSLYQGHHKEYKSFDLEYLRDFKPYEAQTAPTTGEYMPGMEQPRTTGDYRQPMREEAYSTGRQEMPDRAELRTGGDIAINEAARVDGYKAGYEREPVDLDARVDKGKMKAKEITTESQHMTDTKAKDKLRVKLKNSWDNAKRLIDDTYSDVKKISRKSAEMLNLKSQSQGTTDYILNEKLVSKEGEELANKCFKDVLTMKDKKIDKQYQDYLLNRHNLDRSRRKKTLLVDKEGVEITANRSNEIIKQYEEAYPEFKTLAKQYDELWRMFKHEWLADFVPKETLKLLDDLYPHYVPSHRQLESFGEIMPTNKLVAGVKIKQATGSKKKIIPITEQIVEQIGKVVTANRKNEAYKELLKPILKNPEKYKDYVEIVKIGKNNKNMTEREIAQSVAALKDNVVSGEDSIKSLMEVIENPAKQAANQDGYLTIFDNATPITVKIKNKHLFEALNQTEYNGALKPLLTAWNKVVLTPFKGAITQYSPFFTVRNFARDIVTAYVQGAETNLFKFAGERTKALLDIARNDPMWKKYKALGGRMTNVTGNPLKPSAKTGKIKKVFEKYSDVLEVSEQFNRFAEFKKIYKKTGNVNDARIAAANITTNFAKGGKLVKAIDKVIPYSNAATQGLLTTLRAYKNKPVASLMKSIVSTTVPATLLYMYNTGDSEKAKIYKDIPNDVKNTNFVFVKDKNTIIKLPKTQFTGFMFGSIAERAFDYFSKNDDKPFEDLHKGFKQAFFTINPTSGVVMPAINLMLGGNKDYFGRDIVPYNLKDVEPREQYDEKTTTLAKIIGQQLSKHGVDFSPKHADYLLDSWTGVVYDLFKKSAGKDPNKKPKGLIDRTTTAFSGVAKQNFTVNTSFTRTTNDYYNRLDELRTEKATFEKSIAKKKQKVKDQGLSLNSNLGKNTLNSLLTPKEQEKKEYYKQANKTIGQQLEELQGVEDKDKNRTLREYLKSLNNIDPYAMEGATRLY